METKIENDNATIIALVNVIRGQSDDPRVPPMLLMEFEKQAEEDTAILVEATTELIKQGAPEETVISLMRIAQGLGQCTLAAALLKAAGVASDPKGTA